jgi:hypothetical protein
MVEKQFKRYNDEFSVCGTIKYALNLKGGLQVHSNLRKVEVPRAKRALNVIYLLEASGPSMVSEAHLRCILQAIAGVFQQTSSVPSDQGCYKSVKLRVLLAGAETCQEVDFCSPVGAEILVGTFSEGNTAMLKGKRLNVSKANQKLSEIMSTLTEEYATVFCFNSSKLKLTLEDLIEASLKHDVLSMVAYIHFKESTSNECEIITKQGVFDDCELYLGANSNWEEAVSAFILQTMDCLYHSSESFAVLNFMDFFTPARHPPLST